MDSSYDEKILDALCFLYLTFSHATDGELTADEMRTVANKIREWAPNASLEQIGAILESADVADRLRQAPLWRIENTGSREADGAQQWTVSTQRCDLIVWLVPEPPAAGLVGKTGYRVELGSGCE